MMRSTLLLLCLSSIASAWNINSSRLFMGSRAASKAESRSQWYEARGGGVESIDNVPFATIIGSGRIGNMLAENGDCLVVKRGESIPEDGTGPIFIATRNDSLDNIIDSCPEHRRKDLMFLQNGYLESYLESKGLADNSQCLLFVAVTAVGADPIDGITTVNPEGLTAATGEHAEALQKRLNAAGMKCNVLTPEVYKPAMFEKLIWISTYMLVGAAKDCTSVGQAQAEHRELVESVITELVQAVSKRENITFEQGTVERLAAYTDVVANFPAAVKEFEWRNQYFYNLGDEECPTHNALLKECAQADKLSFELP